MKSTPTAALECLLGVTPIGIRLTQVAITSRLRLLHNAQWKHWVGGQRTRALKHNKLTHEASKGIVETQMPCESLCNPPVGRNFTISIQSSLTWISGEQCVHPSDMTCFTDGSRMGEMAGSAFYLIHNLSDWTVRCSIPLGWAPTVYQAEVLGIIWACEELAKCSQSFNSVNFFVDSQSALLALNSPWSSTGLVTEAIRALNIMGESKRISLYWIPSHHGFEGNEIADELAKAGSRESYFGPQPSIPLAISTVKTGVLNWTMDRHIAEWVKNPACNNTKKFYLAPSKKVAKFLLLQNRSNLRSVISILTGHCTLNSHLRTMGIVDVATCICGNGPETVFHFLGDCDRYCALRFSIFGRHTMSPELITTMSLPDLTKFIVKSGRFATQFKGPDSGGQGST